MSEKIIIRYSRAPGDDTMLTALVRDLKLKYGDRYQVDVRSKFPALWRHNPYLTQLRDTDRNVRSVKFDKKHDERSIITLSRRGTYIHYVTAFHRMFEAVTGIAVPVTKPYGDLHLSEEEKQEPNISGRYWIIVPGGKTDMTTKFWHQHRYQEVVDALRPWGLRFVQEGATKKGCVHPPLRDVLNLVGQTSIRDLILNIYHAEGVICGVSFPMHVAGALGKPCVILGGGREEPWWEAYTPDYSAFGAVSKEIKVPHRYLHTISLLPCCQRGGCWRKRTVPLPDGQEQHNKSPCLKPYYDETKPVVPECMHLIQTQHVVDAVMSYYSDGTLPPPQQDVRHGRRSTSAVGDLQ